MKYSIASLNYIDLQKNSGPSINELEFNRWLLRVESESVLFTPTRPERLNGCYANRIITFGKYSLRSPIRAWLQQRLIAKRLAQELAPGAILYYRHTRLASAAVRLKQLRPDVSLVATRVHPSHSDMLVAKWGIRRFAAWMIEQADFKLRRRLYRVAQWIDCVTPGQADLLFEESGKKVSVVMNGVNTNVFVPLSDERRAQVRHRLGIPDDALVVGYCGGVPMQRGAMEISGLVRRDPRLFGVVVGRLSASDRAALSHERMRIIGELPYEAIPELVAAFDVSVALDDPERLDVVGNSNQKVRQALACGTWVMTQASDLPFDDRPVLGCNLRARDYAALSEAISRATAFLPQRDERVLFARAYLDAETIFTQRHIMVMNQLR